MPVLEAEGIVLRHYPLGESDRIVVLLTRDRGQIRGVARGVRRSLSRSVGSLEPLNHIRVGYYLREGADLCRIRRVETIHSFLGREPSLDRVCGFSYFAELAQEMVQENHPNPPYFRLLLSVLRQGEKEGVRVALVRYYEIWSLKLAGFLPDCDYCSGCGKHVKDIGFYARADSGQARCADCSRASGLPIGTDAAGFLQRALHRAPEECASIDLPSGAARELGRLIERLFEIHLEKPLKSLGPLKRALESG